jgi:hypothetical protein
VITPGLWRRALRGGAQWRLLLVWVAGLAIPALAVYEPLRFVLGDALDHSPRAAALVAALDGSAAIDLLHALGSRESRAALQTGLGLATILAVLVSPLLAGAAVTAARASEPPRLHQLLRGAGEWYGRMLRLLLVGVIPLGLASAISAGAFKGASRRALQVYTEGSAAAGTRAAIAVAAVLFFLAHVTLDLARGVFAAQPERRSAFLAWWHGVRVFLRQPLRVLGLALLGTLLALALAAGLMLVRLQITQGTAATVLLALVLSQLAVAAIGWGRAVRVIGLAELVRADAAEQARLAQPPVAAVQVIPAEAAPAPSLGELPKPESTAT